MDSNDTMLVLTSKSMDTMFAEGGCGYWRAKESSILSCRYIVATRNARSNWNQGNEEHGAAFMIGEIAGVTPVDGRYVINISRFALLNVPDVWISGGLNPIRYVSLAETGINVGALDWKAWSAESLGTGVKKEIRSLTIAEAKAGLALSFGVDIEAIEITIRG